MRNRVTVIGFKGEVITKEYNTRDEALFKSAIKYKHTIETPKKGKGSFKRKKSFNFEDF